MKNKDKIRNQFFKNFILNIFALLFLIICAFYFNSNYENNHLNFLFEFKSDSLENFEDLYLKYGLEEAFEITRLGEFDHVYLFNNKYEILNQINTDMKKGDRLTQREFNETFFDGYYVPVIIYLKSNPDNFILYQQDELLGEEFDVESIFIPLLTVFTILYLIFTILFANRASKKIIIPIEKLQEGINKIKDGNYDHKIVFDSGNEIDNLIRDVNLLSQTLKMEISKRKLSEEKQSKFIRNISHDIKTPLTNIIGYSETLLNKKLDKEYKNNAYKIINHNSLKANKLVNELFELSSLEVKNKDEEKVFDIVELLKVKLINYVEEFELKNIDFSFELPDDIIFIEMNPYKLERTIDNIIQNAIKYNQDNFQFIASLIINNSKVIISLEDNGIGIPKEYHEEIFNPLVRVEAARSENIPGSGLGLSIAKQIINNASGNLYIDSDHTKGVKFKIELPVKTK